MSIIMHQGDTSPDAIWQFYDDSFNPVSVPSGSTFQLYIYDRIKNTIRVGSGKWTVNSYSPVNATYQWDALDTASSGSFTIYARITTPSGHISSTDEIQWNILPGLILGGFMTTQDVNIIQVNGTAIGSGNPVPVSFPSLPAGSNLIGSIELTDSGGTNKLSIDASGNASTKLGAALPTGTNVIGHVVVDSAGNVTVTSLPALPAGTNVIGHVIIDSATNVVVTGLPALPAGSNLIGSIEIADSAGTNKLAVNSAGQAQVEDIEQAGYIALTTPPVNTNAGSDTTLTFSSQVNRVIVQNNTGATAYLDFDQTASTASLAILPGSLLVYPKKCTSPHVFTAAATPLNAANGILLRGAL